MFAILKEYMKTKYFRCFHSRSELEKWQNDQVIKHLQHILPLSRFYREHFQGLDLNHWKDFPAIDKTIMMEHFDRLNTKGITKEQAFQVALEAEKTREFSPTIGDITVGLSSGTSGNRGLFIVSPKERFAWAGAMLAKVLHRPIFVKQQTALFMRANSNLYQTANIQFYDLLDSLDKHLGSLNARPPTLVLAPPSMLRLLCDAMHQNQLRISPQKIISIAEVLDPLDEAYISATFQQKVHQIYQCTEGFLAATCSHGTLHLNEDILAVQKEWLDESQRKFMPIITDFRRTSQPILRYRLNDILIEKKEACPCGSVLTALEKIEGRCDDIFYIGGKPVFPDFIRGALLSASTDILEYLVVQHKSGNLEISLKTKGIYPKTQIKNALAELWIKLGCRSPEIVFTPYIAPEGKLRRIKRCQA